MTIPALPEKLTPVINYVVQGSENQFTFKFLVVNDDDMYVYQNGVQLPQRNYTITGVNNDAGGEVIINTTLNPLSIGDVITLSRFTLPEQLTEFLRTGDFTAEAVNAEFTRIYQLLQEFRRDISDNESSNGKLQEQISENREDIDKLGDLSAAAFKGVKEWKQGEKVTDRFQRYFYPNPTQGEPSYTWNAPLASGSNPITMGSSPVGDSNWQQWDVSRKEIESLEAGLGNLAKQPEINYDLEYHLSSGTDNGPVINAIIAKIETKNSLIGFGKIAFKEGGQAGISKQIYINKKSVIISGNNSIIKWIGSSPTNDSMVRIDDSSRCKLEEMVLSGNLANPPFAAIRFYRSTTVDEVGTNENHVIEHVIIGRRFLKDTTTGGSADDTPNGRLQNGIVIDGIDGNNDEYVIKSTQIHNCDNDGIKFANTQSIWSRIQDVLLNNNNIGVRAGCNLIMQNPTFNRNVTADVYGVRDVEVKIDGFNAENSEVFTLSESGASFFIDGGELQMNRNDRGDFFRTLNGGTLSVLNAYIDNIEGTEQRIAYYRAGSSKPTLVKFDCPFIRGGENRDNWDIDSSNEDTCIEIKYRDFEFKTNKPYADRQITPPTVINGEAGLVGSGFHSSPLGDFYNVAYLGDNEGQHITPAFEIATQIRARIYNVSGLDKTLGTSRFRWLNLTDKIEKIVVKSFDLPVINSFKSTTFDVSVPGVNFGDMISVGAKSSTLGLILSAYVKSPSVVTVVASNVSGGLANPSLIDFTIGVVKPFGNRFGGKEVFTQNIASGATIEIDVDCTGAKQGSHAFFTPPGDCLGLTMSCYALTDSVKILITNMTDAAIDVPEGSWAVMCAI